jgi:hypothetical protein
LENCISVIRAASSTLPWRKTTSLTGVVVVQETVSAGLAEENEDAERTEGLEGTLTKVVADVVAEMGAGIMVI